MRTLDELYQEKATLEKNAADLASDAQATGNQETLDKANSVYRQVGEILREIESKTPGNRR